MGAPAPSSHPWRTLLLAGALVVVAACSSGATGTSGGGTPTGSPTSPAAAASSGAVPTSSLCPQVDALRASVKKLTSIRVGAGAGDQLKANLNDVQAKLTDLSNVAGGQWGTQISNLRSALHQLQSAAQSLAATPGTSTASSAAAALRSVSAAAGELLTTASQRCPSPAPST